MSSSASSSPPRAELSLQAQPFADGLIDVAAVNADVSDVLAARIEAVAMAAAKQSNVALTRAYAVLGAAGGGKTHLFARLRHRSGRRPSLVLLRPYFGLGLAPRDVLAATIDQLCAGNQLMALTAHWVGEPTGLSVSQRAQQIEQGVLRIVERLPHAEPAAHIITALLTVTGRVGAERWAELAWLSGREPRSVADRMLSEGDVLVLLRVLAFIAAPVAPLVVVFDQLENLAGDSDTRVLAYGNVIAELVDTVPGLTIVQLAVTDEWTQNIAPRLSLAQRSRVANDLMVIHAPNRGQREALLRAWHTSLYNGAGPAFPAPLAASRLEMLLSEVELTPRKLLAELLDASNGLQRTEVLPLVVPVAVDGAVLADAPAANAVMTAAMPRASRATTPPAPSIAHVWQYETERIADELARRTAEQLPCDDSQLAEAFSAALSFVDGVISETRQERSHVIIEVRATESPTATYTALPCSLLFITGLHHSSVVAALNKGIELAKLGRVVLVREARFPMAETWALVQERRAEFERLGNTSWLWLAPADVLQSVALAELFSQARGKRVRLSDGGTPLPIEAVVEGLRPLLNPAHWSMVVCIVGEPAVHSAVTAAAAAMTAMHGIATVMGSVVQSGVTRSNSESGPGATAPVAVASPQARSFQAPPLPVAPPAGWIRQVRSLGVAAAKDAWRKFRRS